MGDGDFRPPRVRNASTLLPIHDPACKISGGYVDVDGIGKYPVLRMKVTVLFSISFITPTGRIFGHISMHNTSLHVVLANEVRFWG